MEERAGAGAPLSAQSKKETWWSVADAADEGLKNMIDWAWRYGSTKGCPTGVCQLSPPDAIEQGHEEGKKLVESIRAAAARQKIVPPAPVLGVAARDPGLTPRSRCDQAVTTECRSRVVHPTWLGVRPGSARHAQDLPLSPPPWCVPRRSFRPPSPAAIPRMGRSLRASETSRSGGRPPAQIDRNGVGLPNGRFIDPARPTVEVAPHPSASCSPPTPDVATANSDQPFSVSLVQAVGDHPLVRQIPPGRPTDSGVIDALFMGLAYSGDGKTLLRLRWHDGNILVLDPATGTRASARSTINGRSEAATGATATSATCACRRTGAPCGRSPGELPPRGRRRGHRAW